MLTNLSAAHPREFKLPPEVRQFVNQPSVIYVNY